MPFKEDIKETWKLLVSPRMALLYPMMLDTSIILGMYASVFIKMMTDTMDKDSELDAEDKASKALYCMLGHGVGSIIGSLMFGRLYDKLKTHETAIANIVASIIAYACLFLYGSLYEFQFWSGILMTFTWGVKDAGAQNFINCILGF